MQSNHNLPEESLDNYETINWDLNIYKGGVLKNSEIKVLEQWLVSYRLKVKTNLRKIITPILVYSAAFSGDTETKYIAYNRTHKYYSKVKNTSNVKACNAITALEELGVLQTFSGGRGEDANIYKSRFVFLDSVPDNIRDICRKLLTKKQNKSDYTTLLENTDIYGINGRIWDFRVKRVYARKKCGVNIIPTKIKILYNILPQQYQIGTDVCFGGRYYDNRIQNLNKKERSLITINGSNVVEYDYSSLHLRMVLQAYRLTNKIAEDRPFWDIYYSNDPYELLTQHIPNITRKEVKRIINVLLSTITDQSAAKAISDGDSFTDTLEKIKSLRKALHHYMDGESKQYIGAGKSTGTFLQYIDSCIMTEILNQTTKKGVVAFSIHDSLLFEESAEEWVPDLMETVYRDILCIDDPLYPTIVKKVVVDGC